MRLARRLGGVFCARLRPYNQIHTWLDRTQEHGANEKQKQPVRTGLTTPRQVGRDLFEFHLDALQDSEGVLRVGRGRLTRVLLH